MSERWRFSVDLHALRPLLGEASPGVDLKKYISGLRRNRRWIDEGKTRQEILELVDDEFIHHREHYRRMVDGEKGVIKPFSGLKKFQMHSDGGVCEMVISGSYEWDPTPHEYTTRVRFLNYGLIRERHDLSWLDRARLLMHDQVLVDCTCPAFQYYYRYGATKRGFSLIPENRPAKVRNPDMRGSVCKHLEHVLKYMSLNYPVIASGMKKEYEQSMSESVMSQKVRSIALVKGSLREDIDQYGVVDVIRGLAAQCAKRGMARTANALLMAAGMASIEGSTTVDNVPSQKVPDTRFMTPPVD